MTSFVLKLFAMIFMLVDHIAILLFQHGNIDPDLYTLMRTLGRFAFPAYAFLLAEGFRHIKQEPARLRGHATLLLLLTVLSELVFDWFDHGVISYTRSQSVMFTLLLGFAGLWLAESWRGKPWVRAAVFLLAGMTGFMIEANYRLTGVLLIFAFAWYLERFEAWRYGRRLVTMLGVMALYYLLYCWMNANFSSPAAIWEQMRIMGIYGLPHLLLVPILSAYNGKLGFRSRILHRCYQWFYPVHLAILGLIAQLLG